MYLKITPEAQEKLRSKIGGSDVKVLLDFDDGVGALSRVGTCTLASVFRVLLVDPAIDSHDYDESIDTDMGPIAIKGYSKMYMDEDMTLELNEKTQMLRLKGANSGELTAAVNVERFEVGV
ncbi:iron-sulfur cluster biosynthesis family protein [Liquorilactobacillus mali]|uniref:Core domain-containing protein n=3 Tax=Liquorilactobacillus mali TaxID=1618 RepID=A0A0R2EDL4_9LACO|nr:iron-sulfur cluster biosynthesis family protein [Liquorilactobacillus mali]KRN10237.1 hypothetical protein FD00_GL000335 [Liquorilactobacillus mali KCTC 3596 = DSM 20444]MDC7952760.1 iron-sulfur cluster biosynthesis family protein [Liquorilactobacillus mali]MDV7757940.1 iron-sulfur cluster biosynthesis family protein [Liquorilactobacillus mali]QFQ74508.1 iron-sulfur cluster biosynthesis family protein [Liquorilactobacillus mali]